MYFVRVKLLLDNCYWKTSLRESLSLIEKLHLKIGWSCKICTQRFRFMFVSSDQRLQGWSISQGINIVNWLVNRIRIIWCTEGSAVNLWLSEMIRRLKSFVSRSPKSFKVVDWENNWLKGGTQMLTCPLRGPINQDLPVWDLTINYPNKTLI